MPLHGKTILTTRAAAHAGDLGDRLRALGAKVIECPLIEIAPVEDWAEVDRAIAALDSYQWVIFTSANAVDAFMKRVESLNVPIAVVGPATAESLSRWKIQPTLVPTDFRAEGLLAAFPLHLEGTRILFPRAEVARDLLPEELRRRGAIVDIVVVYRTVQGTGMADVRAILARESVDCIVFTSPSTARFFAEALGDEMAKVDGIPVAVIGPVTRDAAEALGFRPAIESQHATTAALATAIAAFFT